MWVTNKETGEKEYIVEIVNIRDRLFVRVETITSGICYKREIRSLSELNNIWEDYV